MELIDCVSCVNEASALAIARSNSQFKRSGVYPTVIFNTSNGLLYKFNVNVERESGIPYVFAQKVAVDDYIQAGYNEWINKYGAVAQKNIEITIDCPDENARCNNGYGRGALLADIFTYTRGHPEVNSRLLGLSGLFTQVKMATGLMKFTINVKFSNGDTFKLILKSAYSPSGFILIEVTDQDGNKLTSSSSTRSSSSGGIGTYGGITFFLSATPGGTAVTVKTCIDGVCSSKVVYV